MLVDVQARGTEDALYRCTEMQMLRWAGVVTLMDKARNEYIRGTFKVAPIQAKMCESRLGWFGHVMRRDNDHITKRAIISTAKGKRGRGRPPTTWASTICRDMKTIGVNLEVTKDRRMAQIDLESRP
ncbi:uncharacterized protein LOC120352190 [Nilaparvata lugens]|uniref:uncharacterized protein LOC120352190 n=1 Tax=Nilaparvata lugens TaxID=108931 RepID=UPI00193E54DF|nr:uncharacterized protein LOC120352190 [Nilaparvata lugens]